MRQAFQDYELVPLTHAELKLTVRMQVRQTLQRYRPVVSLSTDAYHRVDKCEDHPKRYLQPLKAEGHYANMSGFWEYFMSGIERHKVPVPFDKLKRFASSEQWLMLEEMTNSLSSESSQSVG